MAKGLVAVSDTPRTDAVLDHSGEYMGGRVVDGAVEEIMYVPADFARTLERETASLRERIALLEQVRADNRRDMDALVAAREKDLERIASLERELIAARHERNVLQKIEAQRAGALLCAGLHPDCTQEEIKTFVAERDDAVAFIRVLGEELALAGYSGGDRNVTLANVRKLRADRDRLRERIVELERERDGARAEADLHIARITSHEQRLAVCAADRDRLREDAKRYRALRSNAAGTWVISRWDVPAQTWVHVFDTDADAAIDAALKEPR